MTKERSKRNQTREQMVMEWQLTISRDGEIQQSVLPSNRYTVALVRWKKEEDLPWGFRNPVASRLKSPGSKNESIGSIVSDEGSPARRR